jgi:glycosyltransferase involved in cell wall biosynthesis
VKVSVLVPVWNGEAFLAECLESILAQDFADMGILIADDASTDGSVALVERYAAKDSRIRWWKNPNNLGLARNFNCCLRAAKGEYIKYVLQDDKLISPLAIRKMVEVLDNHPEVSLVGSASQILDEHSRVTKMRDYYKPGIMDGRQTIMRCLERANLIGEPSLVMFRRAQTAQGFNEQLPQLLDLDMWFHLLEQGSFAYLAEPLCAFRQHAAQQTKVNRRNGINDRLLLITNWYAKPWVQTSMMRQALFAQIYNLRKNCGMEAESLIKEMMCSLGQKWYAILWCKRKITRPFQELRRQLVTQLKIDQKWSEVFQKRGHGGRIDLEIGKDRYAKRRILVVEACPLIPEQDSGSLRMFNFLRILGQMGIKVTFVADNLQKNHCTEVLQSLGIESLYRPQINNVAKFLKQHSATYDYVILSRLAVAGKYVDLVKNYAPRTKIIFDTVDLHYLRIEREALTKADDKLKRFAAECKKRELAVARKAHITSVVSLVEKQILGKECPHIRIEIVSNIHEIHGRGADFSNRHGLLFIGGFSHAPNVDAVLFFVRNIFPLVEKNLPDVRFHILGSNVPDEITRLANTRILVHGFVQDVGPFFNACKVSVAPLRFGAGIKGKINQSQSYGVPVVATSLAVEGMQLEHGKSVLVADTPEKFAEAIVSIYTNEDLWNQISQNGIKNLEEHFSFNSARVSLENLLNFIPKERPATNYSSTLSPDAKNGLRSHPSILSTKPPIVGS